MAIAQYTLGMFYQDGKLIERDLESARYWLNQAALNYAPGDDFLDDLARRIKLLLTGEQDS
jgi:TPR repeat protein